MRRLIIVVFLSLAWLVSAPVGAAERGALFRLTAYGHSMYLFGTMHVGLPAFYPLEPRIAEAVAKAPVLALELDPEPSPFVAAQIVAAHGMLPAGATGYTQMESAKRLLLEQEVRQAGMDPGGARKLKPVLLAALLSVAEYEKLGYRADLSADRALARLAREHGVPILELESLAGQLDMLDRLAPPDQWRLLDECLESIQSGAQLKEARAVVEAWGSADREGLDEMAKRVVADTRVSGRFARDVVLGGRNETLAGKLDDLLQKKNGAVAAVGVLHLLGQRGVPELLRERGIAVERVY